MRRPGLPGPTSHGGGYIKFSDIKEVSAVPTIYNGSYSGAPGALGQKAGDIALCSDTGNIFIADYAGTFRQVYP